jgi:hypothetical protein
MMTTTGVSGACPTYWRATCHAASMDHRDGYEPAGYVLARDAGRLLWEDLDRDDAVGRLETLRGLFWPVPDGDAVLAWFDRELPRCMALVPAPRRRQFLKGVCRYVVDDGNDMADI